MGQFKRARLSGSDELFRPTQPATRAAEPAPEPQDERQPEPVEGLAGGAPAEPVTDTLSVQLTVDEVRSVVDALQLARFPERQRSRPTMGEFERLGELQDRLRRLVAE